MSFTRGDVPVHDDRGTATIDLTHIRMSAQRKRIRAVSDFFDFDFAILPQIATSHFGPCFGGIGILKWTGVVEELPVERITSGEE